MFLIHYLFIREVSKNVEMVCTNMDHKIQVIKHVTDFIKHIIRDT